MDPLDEARRAVDPETLLAHEDPSSEQPEDAEHWIGVYEELRNTKHHLIANLREMMQDQMPAVRDELERSDIQVLQSQVARFERRLAYWRSKRAAVAADKPSERASDG